MPINGSRSSQDRVCQHDLVNDALGLMWRDLTDAPWLALLLILPAAFSVRSVMRGSVLGWIAPVILVGQLTAWVHHYASNAPNVGVGGAMEFALVPWAFGAVASVAAHVTTRRQAPLPV